MNNSTLIYKKNLSLLVTTSNIDYVEISDLNNAQKGFFLAYFHGLVYPGYEIIPFHFDETCRTLLGFDASSDIFVKYFVDTPLSFASNLVWDSQNAADNETVILKSIDNHDICFDYTCRKYFAAVLDYFKQELNDNTELKVWYEQFFKRLLKRTETTTVTEVSTEIATELVNKPIVEVELNNSSQNSKNCCNDGILYAYLKNANCLYIGISSREDGSRFKEHAYNGESNPESRQKPKFLKCTGYEGMTKKNILDSRDKIMVAYVEDGLKELESKFIHRFCPPGNTQELDYDTIIEFMSVHGCRMPALDVYSEFKKVAKDGKVYEFKGKFADEDFIDNFLQVLVA